MDRIPRILVFDSGLGGLTVFRALFRQRPDAQFFYAADDLGFPYGPKAEAEVVALVLRAMEKLIADHAPDVVVIACNTASTLVLPHLRARWPNLPFVGTVPAIKPAAEQSQSRLISVLATPGTVARDYTFDLIAQFAGHCEVTLVGSKTLAGLAESFVHGAAIEDAEVAAEIAPCFVDRDGRRTDAIVLACTHYPLLLDSFRRLAPWPLRWVDPAPAIALRTDHVISALFPRRKGAIEGGFSFHFTSGATPAPKLLTTLESLAREGASPASEMLRHRAIGQ
ncbi:glutamate racemase [uncultured Rhodoblastus sp.]|uniref:glutamate racemase n=1 Tax=uncultured Rhodoblastus sp. TaxID=543037 RepID=UPI0025F7730B|nr:glutamate racemase [uncultured Rhodoblastus sp.]